MSSDLPATAVGDNDPNPWYVLAKFLDAFELTLRYTPPREMNNTERAQIINITNRLLGPGSLFRSYIEGSNSLLNEGDVTMGDSYTAGQAAVFGPHGQAHEITFNQTWNQISAAVDMPRLEDELSVLRQELKERASAPEHDIAIAEVANAEIAIKNRDGSKLLEHLRKAGKWVLDVAIAIGCALAASMITTALNL